MPVKLGGRGTNGCTGAKPYPLIEVSTGRRVACSGPDRDTALRAMQARNMATAGVPMRSTKVYVEPHTGRTRVVMSR